MKTWKRFELEVAKELSVLDPTAERNPLSGRMSKHGTSSDILLKNLPWYIECRVRSSFFHHAQFREAEAKAKKEGKIPFLVTHEKNRKQDFLVTLKLDEFIKLLEPLELKSEKPKTE